MAFTSRAVTTYMSPDPGDIIEIKTTKGAFTANDIWADPTTNEIHIETTDAKTYNLTLYEINQIIYIQSPEPIVNIPMQMADGSMSSYISTSALSTIEIHTFNPGPGGAVAYEGVVPVLPVAAPSGAARRHDPKRPRVWFRKA